MSGRAVNPGIGWYGKLPGVGDFASRGIARETLAALDDWLEEGLHALQQSGSQWLPGFLEAPLWNMILPAGALARDPVLGCIAPSRDRVGRGFPLTFLVSLPEAGAFCELLEHSGEWLAGSREILRQAIAGCYLPDQLDRCLRQLSADAWAGRVATPHAGSRRSEILEIIGETDPEAITVPLGAGALPWPGLPSIFSASGGASYWWAAPAPGRRAAIPLVHQGRLDAELFCRLFGRGRPL